MYMLHYCNLREHVLVFPVRHRRLQVFATFERCNLARIVRNKDSVFHRPPTSRFVRGACLTVIDYRSGTPCFTEYRQCHSSKEHFPYVAITTYVYVILATYGGMCLYFKRFPIDCHLATCGKTSIHCQNAYTHVILATFVKCYYSKKSNRGSTSDRHPLTIR